ncbi:uncharacterized protein LOC122202180 isoform X3 [Panthera leo]|uniref:uncharacterized protein LOC122202180 isoform X3 n=1 Tax=Panthera leo TaxID=9689 RepID=UPI001C6A34D9|nr:uncharacterized protein LOC122202180 isoform X3 [Panthera leo]
MEATPSPIMRSRLGPRTQRPPPPGSSPGEPGLHGRTQLPCELEMQPAHLLFVSPGANPESLLPGSPSWEGAGVCGRGRRTDAGQPEARAKASHAARAAGRSALEPRVPFAGSKDDLRG